MRYCNEHKLLPLPPGPWLGEGMGLEDAVAAVPPDLTCDERQRLSDLATADETLAQMRERYPQWVLSRVNAGYEGFLLGTEHEVAAPTPGELEVAIKAIHRRRSVARRRPGAPGEEE